MCSQAERFAADMLKWGFTKITKIGTDVHGALQRLQTCPCEAKAQIYNHIFHECNELKPPCHLAEVNNPLPK